MSRQATQSARSSTRSTTRTATAIGIWDSSSPGTKAGRANLMLVLQSVENGDGRTPAEIAEIYRVKVNDVSRVARVLYDRKLAVTVGDDLEPRRNSKIKITALGSKWLDLDSSTKSEKQPAGV